MNKFVEASPNNFAGSITDDLLKSKLLLARELKNIRLTFPVIYVLGSWYGNMAPILDRAGIQFKRLYNVDIDPQVKDKSQQVAHQFGIDDRVHHLVGDVNKLKYKHPSLVINTSCNDIRGDDWYDHIPSNSMIALQGRTNDYRTLVDFDSAFPMRKVFYLDEIELEDPETKYKRFTKIGAKNV